MMGGRSCTCNITEDFVLDRVLTSVTPAEVLEGDDDEEEESVHADAIDGLLCIPFPKNRDSSTSASSNSRSDSDDLRSIRTNRRARRFQSLWSRDNLFSLQSAKQPRNNGDMYHIVTQVYGAAQNEIRVNDRIIEINEKDVRRKSKQEIDILWKGLAKASKIKLKVWRWENDGVGHNVRELKIVFHRVHPDCLIREISILSLRDKVPKAVKNFVWTSEFIPYHIRIASESGIYVFANIENMTLYGEPMKEKAKNNQFRFLVRFFSCIIEEEVHGCNARVGFVVQYGKDFDVSSVLPESTSVLLKRHVPYDTKKLDERFILKLQIPKEEDFFESLSYKNMFMKYDNETKEIRMQQMDGPGPSYLNEMFRSRGSISRSGRARCVSFDIPTVSERDDNLFVLEQIKE
ncbi:uncharacterized protein LOC125658193 [Ostrea edulis]|uniref:uncharacterized protein LOC125658193 n=1 Tax=Ostrea edulis TaxID=37623 RepID=UPI0024AF3809|nr:uncharacterized protein LOC125658193 [Ostrea edulis]